MQYSYPSRSRRSRAVPRACTDGGSAALGAALRRCFVPRNEPTSIRQRSSREDILGSPCSGRGCYAGSERSRYCM
ncbi:hypothetical protein IF1G_01481 [Cordyceps javanica]|uniref:Uncharacterized protein n=1 Tax=Cordyceps javanica TaxID=43265 RepID=A0A545VC16_9HYPO|nr:hypothetical protein IF1G_01481 [Cordyceps javanica]